MVVGMAPEGYAQSPDSTHFRRYRTLDSMIERAGKAVGAGRFEEAQTLLRACLKQIPDHFEAHFLLARIAYEAHDFAGALAHLEIAERSLIDLDRRYREQMAQLQTQAAAEEQAARSTLGTVTSRVSDPSGCAAPLIASLQSDVKAIEARKGPLHGSENPYSIPADYRFLLGNTLLRLGRRDEARARYRQAVEADPGHANAWNNLIALHLGARDLPQARADLERAEAARAAIRPELKRAVMESASGAPQH
jgi:tetratricopeptide (TPR) repeat protein